jgi:hypothetical protein
VIGLLAAGVRIGEERLADKQCQMHLTIKVSARTRERTGNLNVKQGGARATMLQVCDADVREAHDS